MVLCVWILVLRTVPLSGADPLDNWTWRNPLPQGHQLYGVTHGNGLFVAAGAYGTILTSPDATNWTIQTSGLSSVSTLYGVTHGNGQFVAVGSSNASSGTILTSPDGTNWTSRMAATNLPLNAVTYGNGLFVAVGGYSSFGALNTIQTSPDGILWTPRATPTSGGLFGVTFANNLFVTVGGGTTIGGGLKVFASTNGINWTVALNSGGGRTLYAVTYGNGTYVTAGGFAFPSPLVGISTVGTTNWTFTGANGHRRALAFGNNRFVGVGGSTVLSEESAIGSWYGFSTNGTNWLPGGGAITGSLQMDAVTYANGTFVAVGHPGMIITSANGTNWTKRSKDMGGTGGGIFGLAYGSGLFAAAQDKGLFTSADGVTWTNTGPGFLGGPSLRGVVHGNGKFVFWGFQGSLRFLSSYDPTSGTTTPASGMINVNSVAFGNGTFVRVDAPPAGTNQSPIYTSINGIQWTPRNSGVNASLLSIFFDGIRFMTVAGTNMLTSTDGTIWTAQPTTGSAPSVFFTYGNGLYLAGTGGSQIRYSTDGINWTNVFFPNPFGSGSGGSVSFANGHFFAAIGSFGSPVTRIYTSTGGATSPPTNFGNWTLRSAMSPNLSSVLVAFGNDRYVAAGAGDSIMQSDPISGGSAPTLANPRRLAGNEFEFDILASISQLVRIDATTNLAATGWTTLGTVTITNVPQPFRDSAAGSSSKRFYRGAVP
ncbi:MAG: hypothetical protein L0Y58_23730 [Verrucomicrobia subdivision 3 bacterium]|nr:hypothetical protein [Limisphaerales bacterium]